MQTWKAKRIVELDSRRETVARICRQLLNAEELGVSSGLNHEHHYRASVIVPTNILAADLIRYALKEVASIEDDMRELGCTEFDDQREIELTFGDTPFSDLETEIRKELGLQVPVGS